MSTAVASATPTPLPTLDRNPSPRSYPALAPSTAAPSIERSIEIPAAREPGSASSSNGRTPLEGRRSPKSARSTGNPPKITVKKEPPSSPSMQGGGRHRPRKLDLNTSSATVTQPLNSRPSATSLTGRDGLAMLDVGLACLSPGFQTQDPTMREQLQRSISVRDQQRSIIESRLLKTARGDGADPSKGPETGNPFGRPGAPGSKKRPPPGLSIVPPPAEHFANERVIQSAPLNQTFTGRHQPQPPTRHVNQPSSLSNASNVQHAPAVQTNNRLPSLSNVFGADTLNPPTSRPAFYHSNSTGSYANGPPLPSPGFPPQTAHPMSQSYPPHFERPREFRSAEEAVHELTGGREDLLPKIVHYGGHQPPTPPSPQPQGNDGLTPHKYLPNHAHEVKLGQAGRRRSRHEYEADSSPPLESGRERERMLYRGPFGEGRDSPATQKAKKDEFLSLCARAWDLMHS